MLAFWISVFTVAVWGKGKRRESETMDGWMDGSQGNLLHTNKKHVRIVSQGITALPPNRLLPLETSSSGSSGGVCVKNRRNLPISLGPSTLISYPGSSLRVFWRRC